MLAIRLARAGKHKSPFYRVVLTEHTKPVQMGYKEVLGWFDPLKHKSEIDAAAVKTRISKGAQPSNRVAKLIFAQTNDSFFEKYIEKTTRTRTTRNPESE